MRTKGESILIRIAVAVDENGLWSAAGNCAYESDEDAIEAAVDYLPEEASPHRHVVWVEANVPLPAEQTVKGNVLPHESRRR